MAAPTTRSTALCQPERHQKSAAAKTARTAKQAQCGQHGVAEVGVGEGGWVGHVGRFPRGFSAGLQPADPLLSAVLGRWPRLG